MSFPQQGDVLLFQTVDDGEINIVNGVVEMSSGLGVAAYLSLFGGNANDNGLAGSNLTWWGNIDEPEVNQYRSETQYWLSRLSITSSNLLRIEDSVNNDLAWMLSENIASSIDIDVTIPSVNKINITVAIEAQGVRETFNFTENWEASV
jgi:phage gp46-like protein